MEPTPSRFGQGVGLTAAHLTTGTSSFTDFLRVQAPELLPGNRFAAGRQPGTSPVQVPHGTTVVAVMFRGGVLIAGDRRATSGNLIAYNTMDKVYVTDTYSAAGIAGSAGIGVELLRLYAVELQHYEKIEGVSLSLDGKANKLATMVRGNLDAAMAGLVAVPLFVGYDTEAPDPDRAGRIVSFDVSGGRFEELSGYHGIGSGSLFAKSALKKTFDPNADADTAVRNAIEALYDAADDDSATGGPDVARRIYPTVVTVTAADGAVKLPEERTAEVAEAVVAGRMEHPNR
ncbi:MAG TPA: proteasome subunit beta [Pseudonocardiaceae bacterium]|jgi:proteasome beta subunit|nr:proteasome subunit beta [Pseudonocardiaceae bacterium]